MIQLPNAEYAALIAQRDTYQRLLTQVHLCRDALALPPDLSERIGVEVAQTGGEGGEIKPLDRAEGLVLTPRQALTLHRALCALDNAQSRLKIHFHNGSGTELEVTESDSGQIKISVQSAPTKDHWHLAEHYTGHAAFVAAYGLKL